MKPTRDRLRIADEKHSHMVSHVSDAEFHEIATAEGYVKLDVEVEQLRLYVGALDLTGELPGLLVILRQVLAALDGEDT